MRASDNWNSRLKQLWVEYAVEEEREQLFERAQDLIDQVLMFINPSGFEKYEKERRNPWYGRPLTPEEFVQATGRVPELKVELRKPNADTGAAR